MATVIHMTQQGKGGSLEVERRRQQKSGHSLPYKKIRVRDGSLGEDS